MLRLRPLEQRRKTPSAKYFFSRTYCGVCTTDTACTLESPVQVLIQLFVVLQSYIFEVTSRKATINLKFMFSGLCLNCCNAILAEYAFLEIEII